VLPACVASRRVAGRRLCRACAVLYRTVPAEAARYFGNVAETMREVYEAAYARSSPAKLASKLQAVAAIGKALLAEMWLRDKDGDGCVHLHPTVLVYLPFFLPFCLFSFGVLVCLCVSVSVSVSVSVCFFVFFFCFPFALRMP
jgi:hypothetical protein